MAHETDIHVLVIEDDPDTARMIRSGRGPLCRFSCRYCLTPYL